MNLKDFFVRMFPSRNKSSKGANIELKHKDKKKTGLRYRIKKTFTPKANLQIGKWESAILAAENPDNPIRYYLYLLYEWAIKDSHLRSQLRTAHITVKRSDFVVQIDKQDNEEMTELFEKPWFSQYVRHALDSEFWGHSLIEFDPELDENKEFKTVHLIPREHVRPETHEVLLNPFDNKGINYKAKPFNQWLIEVGEPDNLGTLESSTREVIYKTYGRTDWSIRSEKFGMPIIVLNTASSDEKELDAKAEMLASMGANSWGLFDDEDKLTLTESSSAGNGHVIYKDNIELCDKYMSKVTNGQTGTSDEKAFVGGAEVHERILNDYGFERLSLLESHINFELIPFLKKHDYKLEGGKFRFVDLIKKESEESTEGENVTDPKKEQDKINNALGLFCLFYEEKAQAFEPVLLTIDLDKLVNDAAKRVHEGIVTTDTLDSKTWLANVQELWDAVQTGFDDSLVNTSYQDPRFELMTRFRDNIQVFAAFKNHHEVAELVGQLKNENGELKLFPEFKQDVTPIIGKYEGRFLEAEFNHSVASSQMSDKWVEFEENKEDFPFLRYTTQGDGRVRDSHAELDGITLPIESPFWDEFFPPIGWNCRCIIKQVAEQEKTPDEADLPSFEQVPQVFRNNPARTGELFNESHAYFDGMSASQASNIILQKSKFVFDSFPTSQYKKLIHDDTTGGYAVKHKKHDKDRAKENTATAKILAKQGHGIELVSKAGNAPSAIWDGTVFSFKNIESAENIAADIAKAINEAKEESNRLLIVFAKEVEDLDIDDIVISAVKDSNIIEVAVLNGEKEIFNIEL